MTLKPTTLEEQVNILRERDMLIEDEDKKQLLQYGYYNVINGYKEPFIDKEKSRIQGKEMYRDGTTIHQLISLYNFDKELRKNILYLISHIEILVKSTISLHFSLKYGSSHWNYLTPQSFTPARSKKQYVYSLISQLQSTIGYFHDKRPHPVICHHLDKYDQVPLWALNTVLSFGTMSKFYDNLTDDMKKKIAKSINPILTPKTLSSLLYFLTDIRNKCAHGNRLYSHRIDHIKNKRVALIPALPLHATLQIPYDNKINQYNHGQNDVLAILIAIALILPPNQVLGINPLAVNDAIAILGKSFPKEVTEYILSITGCYRTHLELLNQYLLKS